MVSLCSLTFSLLLVSLELNADLVLVSPAINMHAIDWRGK